MNSPAKSQILAQIAQIQFMERGKLSTYSFPDRSSHAGPYYKLPRWEDSKKAIRRGLAVALPVVLRINGAEGLANMGRLCFLGALQIVDFYHAVEHAGNVLVALLGSKEHPDDKTRLGRRAKRLFNDKVEQLMAEVRRECAGKSQAQAVEKELGYFLNNVVRMQYGTFRARGSSSDPVSSKLALQDPHRPSLQRVWHVLGRARCRKQPGVALHPGQPPAERVLEKQAQPSCRSQRLPPARGVGEDCCPARARRRFFERGLSLSRKGATLRKFLSNVDDVVCRPMNSIILQS